MPLEKDLNPKEEDIEKRLAEKHIVRALPKPHRCNDRVEDVIQALFTLEFSKTIRPAWQNFRACMKSEVGQEPDMPYLVIADGQKYLVAQERKDPPQNFRRDQS